MSSPLGRSGQKQQALIATTQLSIKMASASHTSASLVIKKWLQAAQDKDNFNFLPAHPPRDSQLFPHNLLAIKQARDDTGAGNQALVKRSINLVKKRRGHFKGCAISLGSFFVSELLSTLCYFLSAAIQLNRL